MDNLLSLIRILGRNIGSQLTLRQLASDAAVPYTTANRLIKKNSSLFMLEKKGSSILCSLNTKDRIILSYLALSERRKAEDFYKKNKEAAVIKKDLPQGDYTAVLFGSRADENHRKESDIDIILINKDGRKNISFSKYALLFKIEINPIFMSAKEFGKMLKEDGHNLADEIIKKHIILYNEEYFWKLVLENGI